MNVVTDHPAASHRCEMDAPKTHSEMPDHQKKDERSHCPMKSGEQTHSMDNPKSNSHCSCDHTSDTEANQTTNCDTSFGCNCLLDDSSANKPAVTAPNVQLPVIQLASITVELVSDDQHFQPSILFYQDYSPPPLFLVNASFLI